MARKKGRCPMLTNRELARIEPRAFMRRMLRDFDRFFEEGWTPFQAPAKVFGELPWTPAMEVVEKDKHLVARFELPGVKKEEINVTVTDEGLTVEGERKTEEEEKNANWYRTERTYGKFVRTIPLPVGVNPAEIKAAFENGVLELTVPLPAAAVAAAPRKIEIAGEESKVVKPAA
jgi:HSP20 family protein